MGNSTAQKTRYIMNFLLLVFFISANVPQVSLPFHEWMSFVFMVPLVVHLLLHYSWILTIPRRLTKNIRGEIRFNLVFNILLYLLMIFVIVSGILASQAVLPLLMNFEAEPFWTELHHKYSNLLIIFVGIHLGMHWQWIADTTKAMIQQQSKKPVDSNDIQSQ